MSLSINNKDLTLDFDSYIATRNLANPKKKSIKEAIPFSNVVYDFSAIDGEVYYEERELTYTIDIAEITAAEMETKRSELIKWLFGVHEDNIYDPYLGNYHLKGTFDSDSWAEDFGAGELGVTFLCYPYKIANEVTENIFNINGSTSITVNNESSHPIIPTLTASVAMTITINGSSYSIGAGTITDDRFKLAVGANTLTVNSSTAGTLKVSYFREVL